MKPRVLVSACLLGVGCRYDGNSKGVDLERLMSACALIPVCPEQLGGLPTPRAPSECRGDGVFARDGSDVTVQFRRGAEETAGLAETFGAKYALLKAKSPSCGVGAIYDGSFTGTLVPGMGMAAQALSGMGVKLYDESHIDELLKELEDAAR